MIRSKKRKLLILDFDGTLANIAKSPDEVILEKKTQDVLTLLSRSPKNILVILSGRSLRNLKAYFHLKNVIFAGNHGLELSGSKIPLPLRAKKARRLKALVWLLGEKIRESLSMVPGILIEDKGYTLSLHYRNISSGDRRFFNQEVRRIKKRYAHWPIIWKAGKKVWEAHPKTKWGKGHMALYLSNKFPGAQPIAIGDDVTDEDMFRTLRGRGITIQVGRSKRTLAKYRLGSPKGVLRFLAALAAL